MSSSWSAPTLAYWTWNFLGHQRQRSEAVLATPSICKNTFGTCVWNWWCYSYLVVGRCSPIQCKEWISGSSLLWVRTRWAKSISEYMFPFCDFEGRSLANKISFWHGFSAEHIIHGPPKPPTTKEKSVGFSTLCAFLEPVPCLHSHPAFSTVSMVLALVSVAIRKVWFDYHLFSLGCSILSETLWRRGSSQWSTAKVYSDRNSWWLGLPGGVLVGNLFIYRTCSIWISNPPIIYVVLCPIWASWTPWKTNHCNLRHGLASRTSTNAIGYVIVAMLTSHPTWDPQPN